MKDKKINIQYILLQGLYWMMFCPSAGFIAFYLQGNGFGNSMIGVITAVFCLVAVILQPMAGNLCDRIKILTWKRMIILLGLPYVLICIMLFIVKERWLIAVLFGSMYIIASIYLPMINTGLFAYEREGIKLNFGVARGTGSAMYAIMALLIGNMALRFGTKIIPASGLIIMVLLLFVVSTMPPTKKSVFGSEEYRQTNVISFIRKYPYFSIMLLAVIFIFFHIILYEHIFF